ncbi:hypothetical protein A2U01_0042934, partial [Trifolium medium]|nr:hypothetical protein [Trifolium medium]
MMAARKLNTTRKMNTVRIKDEH